MEQKELYEVLGRTCALLYETSEREDIWQDLCEEARETAKFLAEENKRLKEELKNMKNSTKWNGTMEIVTATGISFRLTGEWEYSEQWKCWYHKGSSFPAEICRKVEEA